MALRSKKYQIKNPPKKYFPSGFLGIIKVVNYPL